MTTGIFILRTKSLNSSLPIPAQLTPPPARINGLFAFFNSSSKENGSISYGALEKANKGTLLIDQVSEIPLDIQSKILRVLTDQKFKRLNGNDIINVDVRLICSSSKNLLDEIKIGNFREDLYHRLNVFEINIIYLDAYCKEFS